MQRFIVLLCLVLISHLAPNYASISPSLSGSSDHVMTYHYTETHQLQMIEHYWKDPLESLIFLGRERLFWREIEGVSRLVSCVLEDALGKAILCYSFYYDEQGQITQGIVTGSLSGTCEAPLNIKADGYPEANGIESYCIDCPHVDEHSPIFREAMDLLITKDQGIVDTHSDTLSSTRYAWNYLSDLCVDCVHYVQTLAYETAIKWNDALKQPAPLGSLSERIAKEVIGDLTYLLLMGHPFEESEINCYGAEEVSDKVRVTFINGILTAPDVMFQNLEILSQSHGGTKIHYVFRPTEGWTSDISRAILVKTAFTVGFRSSHAYLLAQMWRDLIAEMGGLEGGGTIIHYAHSIGGSETDRARELLSLEEQQRIRVVTLGSVTLIRDEGFQSVTNYVSTNDGVSSVLLEPLGYVRNYFDPNTNVRILGSFWNQPYWPLDHLLHGPTYGPVLSELGKNFLVEFRERI